MKRIESPKNTRLKEWKKLHTKKGREENGHFLLEGPHLVEAAIKHHIPLTDMIMTENFEIPTKWELANSEHWIVTDRVMKELAATEKPQGIVAISPLLEETIQINKSEKYVLLDGIQDPGNLGTIIRTADSAGFKGIIMGNGTVDLYNSKVIRATQGSIFHLPIIRGNLDEWIPKIISHNIPVFGTALEGARAYTELDPLDSFAIILGNEGNGVRQELLDITSENLYIPIYGQAESLNVAIAAGILFYGLSKHE